LWLNGVDEKSVDARKLPMAENWVADLNRITFIECNLLRVRN